MIHRLHWDSDFFNFNIGKCVAIDKNFEEEFLNNDYKLIYYFVNQLPCDFPVLNKNIFDIKLVDIKVVFSKKLNNTINDFENISEYDKKKHNYSKLILLAKESGNFSRFKLDNNFGQDVFDKFYTVWLENSLNNIIADHVYVYESEGIIKGFITISFREENAVIGLISVDQKYRGENIGSALLSFAENVAKINNISVLEVATQFDNILACNFYIKNNFRIKEQLKIFHIWKKEK